MKNQDIKNKIVNNANDLINGKYKNIILGVGLPLLLLSVLEKRQFMIMSENGAIGMSAQKRDGHVIDAGRNIISLRSGGCILDSVQSFALIRSGRIDIAIVGALEVDRFGNIACHSAQGRLFGYGGAIDIYHGARKVMVMMRHYNHKRESKFVEKLTLPMTAAHVVNFLVTEKISYVF